MTVECQGYFKCYIVMYCIIYIFFQYDDDGMSSIFLTPSQKSSFQTLKKTLNSKPKKSLYRPEVSVCIDDKSPARQKVEYDSGRDFQTF